MVDEKYAQIWQEFARQEQLTDRQLEQFQHYHDLLISWNERINLTAITSTKKIIQDHFMDSLAIEQFTDMKGISSIADVGSGAGFPGIPLKIKFPHLTVTLIEVTQKKVEFLTHVIDELHLDATDVVPLDWRSFLRTTGHSVDLFVARASLQPEELVRMFKPSCEYNNATLVYWASQDWQPTDREKPYIWQEKEYEVGAKKRRYIFFKKPI
jgi:16S rRNA (guanine527-N7)-methyltransferase